MTSIPTANLVSVHREGPCQDWTTEAEAVARCNNTTLTTEAWTFGIALASVVLWNATGRRYGVCRRTVRPCYSGTHHHGFGPTGAARARQRTIDALTSTAAGYDIDDAPIVWPCSCGPDMLTLPGPIEAVESILYAGQTLPTTAYRIRTAGHRARTALLRLDGDTWWCCNDLDADPTVAATDQGCPAWQVTYWQGRQLPDLARNVASILAEELAKSFCGEACDQKLHSNLVQISRRGVTKQYDPKAVKGTDGLTRTGLTPVDAWIAAVNPNGRTRQSAIIRADDPENRRIWEWIEVE
ncbi:MAG: hypothetical protein ACRBK7_14415 [Acidimicrobiales bacterium]